VTKDETVTKNSDQSEFETKLATPEFRVEESETQSERPASPMLD